MWSHSCNIDGNNYKEPRGDYATNAGYVEYKELRAHLVIFFFEVAGLGLFQVRPRG